MNKCTDCKVQISPYQTRCYKCKVEWHDSYKGYVHKVDHEDYENDLA